MFDLSHSPPRTHDSRVTVEKSEVGGVLTAYQVLDHALVRPPPVRELRSHLQVGKVDTRLAIAWVHGAYVRHHDADKW